MRGVCCGRLLTVLFFSRLLPFNHLHVVLPSDGGAIWGWCWGLYCGCKADQGHCSGAEKGTVDKKSLAILLMIEGTSLSVVPSFKYQSKSPGCDDRLRSSLTILPDIDDS